MIGLRVILGILLVLGMALPGAAWSESLTVVRPIRAMTQISPEDLVTSDFVVEGAINDVAFVAGMEARTNLYPGRPIFSGDIGPIALVERNQLVIMQYRAGGLTITTKGRALGRAGIGEIIQVMNLDSKTIVSGRVAKNSVVEVGQ